ncbi:hypothetical protein EYR38_004560 [Pleurotus pulmonarius]|nr:hypothetical protein EYR38_004560 [Pleurotus pulmonarius]
MARRRVHKLSPRAEYLHSLLPPIPSSQLPDCPNRHTLTVCVGQKDPSDLGRRWIYCCPGGTAPSCTKGTVWLTRKLPPAEREELAGKLRTWQEARTASRSKIARLSKASAPIAPVPLPTLPLSRAPAARTPAPHPSLPVTRSSAAIPTDTTFRRLAKSQADIIDPDEVEISDDEASVATHHARRSRVYIIDPDPIVISDDEVIPNSVKRKIMENDSASPSTKRRHL